ncbi:MAG: PQQ-like beta-propeller repeat protein [Candidatus Latescibacteria bacterium]|nr:PQQ-like beta-propeller repeat protein [Candidatus Latescibacterota bacterium]
MRNTVMMLNYPLKKALPCIVRIRKNRFSTIFIYVVILGLLSITTSAQENKEWPCFHCIDRSNKSTESDLLKKWPEEGPKLLWSVAGLGEGYSSVAIANGFVFTAGKKENQTYVFAYDLKGKLIWEKPNGQSWSTTMSWAKTYTGPRSTPTYNDGVVYHLGETGRLTAFDHKTGTEIWFINLQEKFDAQIPEYGYSESVLVDGDYLYCNPVGEKAFMVCLNKKDGKQIWANTEISGVAGYSSPVLMNFDGYNQIINMSSNCVYGVDTRTGNLLWSMKFEGQQSLNNTDPIVHDEYVFVSSGYGKGCMLIKLLASGKTIIPEMVWQTELMDNHHGGVILLDEHLYGAGHNSRGWFCLDFLTGKELWKSRGKGSLVFADNMLYLLEENGLMKLVTASHEKYDEVSLFEVPDGGRGMHWAHPVVCGGRLYIRHTDKLFAYDIKNQ